MPKSAIAQSEKVYRVEVDREDDGRWIADIPELPGVMAYGDTQEAAVARVQALAYRVLADRIDSELKPHFERITFEQVA